MLGLAELWRYHELLFFLSWRDIKVRYKQTVLGAAWAILQPLATMVAFSLFLGRVAGSAAAPRSKNAIESARRRGRKSGKRTNGSSYSKHKHEPGQAGLCLPESRQRLRLYDKEMVHNPPSRASRLSPPCGVAMILLPPRMAHRRGVRGARNPEWA